VAGEPGTLLAMFRSILSLTGALLIAMSATASAAEFTTTLLAVEGAVELAAALALVVEPAGVVDVDGLAGLRLGSSSSIA
jgi:hypothetical protein